MISCYKKYKNKKVGAIGELLLNVLMREFTDMKVVSPFFNLEERNAKKGAISVVTKMEYEFYQSTTYFKKKL